MSARTIFSETLLEATVKGNQVGIIRKLKAFGYDFAEKAVSGESPLTIAAENGYIEASYALLECGVDPEFRRRCDGKTALEVTQSKNSLAFAYILNKWVDEWSGRFDDLPLVDDTRTIFQSAH
ncbi:MAG: hypothetical protein Q9219_002060 [cf. Caloplaca sp. 3 TL-2023]